MIGKYQYVITLSYLLILFISYNKNNENDSESTPSELADISLDYNTLKLSALNGTDLDFLDNCGKTLLETSVNSCGIIPDTVEIGGLYVAGIKFVVKEGNSPVVEPTNSSYEWKLSGEGISSSPMNKQFIVIRIEPNFKEGTIEGNITNKKGGGTIMGHLRLRQY